MTRPERSSACVAGQAARLPVGGAMGLYLPSILIVLPLGMLTFFTIGIASVTPWRSLYSHTGICILRFTRHHPLGMRLVWYRRGSTA
ncbi:MAG: hypothetical protein IPP55_16995 [Anaerolineales bacterium]|nr:hypothetical protein [Anaerolineales bacterium]